jgi:ribosomal protein S18 acetylase RimI-like enzyme
MFILTTDKQRLLEHFRKDPVLFAYHLGDLDDFYFPHCIWGAVYGESSAIDDVLLLYTGCNVPSLLAFGVSGKFPALLSDFVTLLPSKFYCHFQKQYHSILADKFRESYLGTHLKMKLGQFTKGTTDLQGVSPVRLGESDEEALRSLYIQAYPGNYFVSRMLKSGKYFGCRIDGQIVAVAGVHVDSDEYGIAVLGNVATHPDHRGKRLATMLTSRLVEELVSESKLICLNVNADNHAAIHCYLKLGFEKVYEYEESLFEAR